MNKDMNLIMENWRGFLTEEEKEKKIEFLVERVLSPDASSPLTEEEIIFLLEEGALSKIWNTAHGFIKKLSGVAMKPSNLANIILGLSKDVESIEYKSSGSFNKQNALLKNTLEKIQTSKLTKIPLKKLRVFNKISRGVRIFQTVAAGWAWPTSEWEKAKNAVLNAIQKGEDSQIQLNEEESLSKEERIQAVKDFFNKFKDILSAQKEINELTSGLETIEKKMNKMLTTSEQDDKSIYDFLKDLYDQMGASGKGSPEIRHHALGVLRDFLSIYKGADTINDRFKEIGSIGKALSAAFNLGALAYTGAAGGTVITAIAGIVMAGSAAPVIASVATALAGVNYTRKLFQGAAGAAAEKANKEELSNALAAAKELEAEFQ